MLLARPANFITLTFVVVGHNIVSVGQFCAPSPPLPPVSYTAGARFTKYLTIYRKII